MAQKTRYPKLTITPKDGGTAIELNHTNTPNVADVYSNLKLWANGSTNANAITYTTSAGISTTLSYRCICGYTLDGWDEVETEMRPCGDSGCIADYPPTT